MWLAATELAAMELAVTELTAIKLVPAEAMELSVTLLVMAAIREGAGESSDDMA